MCVCILRLAPLRAADLRAGAAAGTETAAGSIKLSSWGRAAAATGSNTGGRAAACKENSPGEREVPPGTD